MNIAGIQKRKFLNNLYKLYYSSGKQPSNYEIRSAFNQYFRVNKFGDPITIDTSELQGRSIIDPNTLNELMINTLLNMEVLYDCVMENNQEVFVIVNTLNNKLDNLRAKRKDLESRIDQLLFANSNTDGYFYSYLENFSSLGRVDMGLTSAFVDTVNNNAKIPKIVSNFNNQLSSFSIINPSSVTFSVTYNNTVKVNNTSASDFSSTVDGLNDTYWSYQYNAVAPGIVALTISIPVSLASPISKFEGSIISSSPCAVFLRAAPVDPKLGDVIRTKNSTSDFSRFSFNLPAYVYGSLYLTIYKNEPDRVVNSESSPYQYDFGIRELSTAAEYYEERAQLVSVPISIPTNDNRILSIGSVAIEASHQIVPSTNINYYIARDVENPGSISDFDWIPIEPSNLDQNEQSKVVNLLNSNFVSEIIDNQSAEGAELVNYSLIPLNLTSQNANELNPNVIPFYTEKQVYRVARVTQDKTYLQSYMLANINTFRYYSMLNITYNKVTSYIYKSLQDWANLISSTSTNELSSGVFQNTNSIITIPRNEPHSGLLETKLFCSEDREVSHEIIKTQIGDQDINLSVYLNGVLIADMPKGQYRAKVDWNFVRGINNISIAYDKDFSGRPTIDLMVNRNLIDYGTIFLDYFSYLDPIEFGRKANPNENNFTITNYYGTKEILATKQITNRTILRYYSDRSDIISAIRYRVDLERYGNPLQTPVVDAIRVKFKHSD